MIKRLLFYSIFALLISSIIYFVNINYSNSSLLPNDGIEDTLVYSTPKDTTVKDNDTSLNSYSILQGDTLYSIGKKYNMLWTVIAKVNNLDENSKLVVGQVLQIPTENEAKTIQTKTDIITPDQEELDNIKSAQEYALAGKDTLAYRKNPIDVVKKSRLLIRYQFADSDLYLDKSINLDTGVAIVEITHRGSLYTVTLNAFQLGQGNNTVWTPVKITY